MSRLLSASWRDLPEADKRLLRDRLAVASAKIGRPLGDAATPGELMTRLRPGRVVQRAHLEAIDAAAARVLAGEIRHLMIWTPPQIGKPVASTSMILMADGSRRPLSTIRVGDRIITHTGTPQRVTAVHEQGALPVLRITTYAGRETTAAYDHPFLTPEGWVKAADLVVGQSLAAVPRPQTEPSSTLTPEAARLLGYFVGDGSTAGRGRADSSCNASITCATDATAVIDEVHRCADAVGFTYRHRNHATGRALAIEFSGGVRAWLREHGLARQTSRTKRVPPEVFTSPPHVIAEFLGGYWDCDGVVSSRGKARDGSPRPDVHCELYSVSRELLGDVQHLLLRLGIRSQIRTKIGTYKNAEHVSYRLALIKRDDVARFRSVVRLAHAKKAVALAAHPLLRTDFDTPFQADPIVAIEPAGEQDCRCLTVETDHSFTSDDLVVHNSERAAVALPFWWLTHRPQDRVMLLSYAEPLAAKRGRDVRKLIEEHGLTYGLELATASKSVTHWELSAGGGMRCAGIAGSITGMAANLLVVDDPHKNRAEAESPEILEKIWNAYSGDVTSRLAPGAVQIIIQTRWSLDDLSGRLLERDGRVEEGGKWTVIHIPAIADPGLVDPDPLGRAPGEPCPHPVIDVGDLEGLRAHWREKQDSSSVKDWHALYQGDPTPAEGALTTVEILERQRVFDGPAATRVTAVAIDPSGGGRDVAGIVGGHLGADKRLYTMADRSGRMRADEWGRAACVLAAELDADRFVAEQNYGGDMIASVLRTSWDALRRERDDEHAEWLEANPDADPEESPYRPNPWRELCPRIVLVNSKKGKRLRAEPVAQKLKEGWIYLVGRFPQLEKEWLTWSDTSPTSPGRLDAHVHLALALLRPPGTDTVVSAPKDKPPAAGPRQTRRAGRISRR